MHWPLALIKADRWTPLIRRPQVWSVVQLLNDFSALMSQLVTSSHVMTRLCDDDPSPNHCLKTHTMSTDFSFSVKMHQRNWKSIMTCATGFLFMVCLECDSRRFVFEDVQWTDRAFMLKIKRVHVCLYPEVKTGTFTDHKGITYFISHKEIELQAQICPCSIFIFSTKCLLIVFVVNGVTLSFLCMLTLKRSKIHPGHVYAFISAGSEALSRSCNVTRSWRSNQNVHK